MYTIILCFVKLLVLRDLVTLVSLQLDLAACEEYFARQGLVQRKTAVSHIAGSLQSDLSVAIQPAAEGQNLTKKFFQWVPDADQAQGLSVCANQSLHTNKVAGFQMLLS